ncbi:protein SUPPRESSOR OF K(+) TRANSPORT GROWTH DEFECT 1 [Sesamum angolense]|uniref:Protein SUPPRESSOR OF K(+) TRANSPORT GROWTH DEFECT 1 n=1 Tax=Sesamum angolense TaxID=2727404 RepID=A0AAE2C582_9LAMI|nr:protein SUPPRESSOR OF K(+) TRANSPORT GROWTH DEFECT 1 [Sesamum angolense]
MYSNFKEQAIEYVRQAVAEDNAGNYARAFQLYMNALEYFKTHLKYEKNPKIKEAITQKFTEYLRRAEEIRAVRDEGGSGPASNGDAAVATRPKTKPKDGNDGEDGDKEKLRAGLNSAIIREKPNVKWNDVAGLESAKQALQEAVILPVKFPQFFTGKRRPWRAFLLYGPPGTGKSYLAKAVATEADSTFFSVSSSDLVSKWMGESEKLVSNLFQMARESSPSIIFIDEIDSLCGTRGEGNESEASRRIKTELLVQMQGVGHTDDKVLVLAATNTPYSLDQAIRRRFDKRIYIPLPDVKARQHMFKVHLGDTPHNLTESDFEVLGRKTEGFSGSDISVCVKDVLFEPVRKTQDAMFFIKTSNGMWMPCGPKQPGAIQTTMQELAAEGLAAKGSELGTSQLEFILSVAGGPGLVAFNFDKRIDHSTSYIKNRLWALETGFHVGTSTIPYPHHYIVYMGDHSFQDSESVVAANHEMLTSVMGSYQGAQGAAVNHYTKTFRGFSAMLTSDQAKQLAGVWPESKSFSDYGLGPVPAKFKGECTTGENFTLSNCNRKIVGARFYYGGFIADNGPLESFNHTFFLSARDSDGHGTHTSSTIAGSVVANVSLYGIGRGTARGGAPKARLAIYKACWFNLCSDADILSAIDDAINDGVDVISMSLGPDPPQPIYFSDAISIGSFHAFQKGVVVSASAGNSFLPKTASNIAPWILTVAASTMDRDIQTKIYLGNSQVIQGFSVNPTEMKNFYGLVAGSAAAAPGIPSRNASFCKSNTLDPALIKGKIVVCTLEAILDNRKEKAISVKQGGGVGIILVDPLATDIAIQFVLPGALIGLEEAEELQAYMASQKNPVARISQTTAILAIKPAPQMAMFSSMGPNIISPDVIKPDITAPGVNVLAAWSPLSTDNTAGRSIDYNIVSGTSMSCPHVSALAAIVKSSHPSWSPAAIKSALMTTATIHDNTKNFIRRHPNGTQTSPFDYGSGHINPAAAIDPGLVYDFDTSDIIDFLCSTGATPAQLKNLTGEVMYCRKNPKSSYDFNYPSIGVSNLRGSISVHRTVTYYGEGPAVYKAEVDHPAGVNVSVTPNELRFEKIGDKMSFVIGFTPYKASNGDFVFGALTWTNGVHVVRSPIGLNILSV